MIVVRYRHESDENHFLTKLKHMKRYVEDVIDCVENKDGEYEEYDDEDYEDEDYDDEDYDDDNDEDDICKSQRVFRIINCMSIKELNLSTNWFSCFDCAELISK